MKTTFANRLRMLRSEKGLTQDELANELKVSKSRIGMYELGNREPDFETQELIADYFNVDMNYLHGYDVPKSAHKEMARSTQSLSDKELELISLFRGFNKEGKSMLLKQAELMNVANLYNGGEGNEA